ncbi:MAG: hypothetical protein U0237_04390 [Thermoleophilia bacterium]
MTARGPAPAGRPLLPSLAALAGALAVCVTVFLPWYEPVLAEPLAPDAVSGWDATTAARIAVAGAVLCALCSLAVALDARDLLALDAGGISLLSIMSVAGAGVAAAAIAFRAIRLPEPSAVLSRELGLYLALLAALGALAAGLIQLVVSSTGAPAVPRRAASRPRG